MKTIIDEVDAPSTGVSDFGLSRVAALAGLAMETKSDDLNQSGDDIPSLNCHCAVQQNECN